MADQIRVNGVMHDWGSIICKIDNERFHGFDQISFADKLEVAMHYGTGIAHAPRARTGGKYAPEPAKLRGPTASMKALREKLAQSSSSGRSYGRVEFEIVIELVSDEGVSVTELRRCRYIGTSSSWEEGSDPLKEEIELSTMAIIRDGLTLFEDPQGAFS